MSPIAGMAICAASTSIEPMGVRLSARNAVRCARDNISVSISVMRRWWRRGSGRCRTADVRQVRIAMIISI